MIDRKIKLLKLVLVVSAIPYLGFAQIDHWESVILEGDEWKYHVPSTQPSANWTDLSFDDSGWNSGPSGFGYDDGDDNTILPNGTISVYLRKEFTIIDKSAIGDLLLHIDYDDGFVAYLNGTEVARSLVSGSPPSYDQTASTWHEAVLYNGSTPESFDIDADLLRTGSNILAIQVHNQSPTSSDMSAISILSLGVNNSIYLYRNTPSWFVQPLSDPGEFTQSNLPIVVIDSRGNAVVDEPKVFADIGIIYNGPGIINRLTDDFNEFEGFCGIELRGESSLSFDKKSYGIETWDQAGNDIDTTFLGFPSEEDFILHGPYSDKTLMNNAFAMHLAREMRNYSSRTRHVELVINGDYKGVYLLMERIKRDRQRVDIARLRSVDISGDQLTGGYIFRIDKGNDNGWPSKYDAYAAPGNKIFFQYFYPDQDDIQTEQKLYIKAYVDQFEDAIASSNYRNSAGKRYNEFIDLRSFVDNWILNELTKDVDAYRLSTYFHKDKESRGGKLRAGPFWDFNLSLGNNDYTGQFNNSCVVGDTFGWQYYQCPGNSPSWWHNMLQDTLFTNSLKCRWESIRQTFLSTSSVDAYIDSVATQLAAPQARNFNRWPILGTYIWPNPPFFENAQTYDQVIFEMKRWIRQRSEWIDNNLDQFVGSAQNCDYYERLDNHVPTILGFNDGIKTTEEIPITLSIEDFNVRDRNHRFPDDFESFQLYPGANYTLNGNEVVPDKDYDQTLLVRASMNDGLDESEIFEVPLEIVPVNDAPVITSINALGPTSEQTPVDILVSDINIVDPDNTGEDFTVIIQEGENYTVNANRILPAAGFTGTLNVSIAVNDGSLQSQFEQVSILVNPILEFPTITAQSEPIIIQEDIPSSIPIESFIIVDPEHIFPDDFSILILPGENYTVDNNVVTPNSDFNGELSVPVIVNNGTKDSNTFTANITVSPVNDVPIILGLDENLSIRQGRSFIMTLGKLLISDVDNSFPEDFVVTVKDGLNYSKIGNEVFPDDGFVGTLIIRVTVNDGQDESDVFDFPLEVTPVASINLEALSDLLTVYPNPAENVLNIQLSNAIFDNVEVTMMDLTGKILYEKSLVKMKKLLESRLDLSQLDSGMILLRIKQGNFETTKLIRLR